MTTTSETVEKEMKKVLTEADKITSRHPVKDQAIVTLTATWNGGE